MHEHKVIVRYMGEMLVTMFLYAIFLVVSIKIAQTMHPGIAQTIVVISPMIPFLLMVWAVVRQIRRIDEYARLQTLENIAIAFGVTAGCVFTYGFLEGIGFPRLSMFTVWSVMMSVWAVLAITRMIANR